MNHLILANNMKPSVWNGTFPRWGGLLDEFDRLASTKPVSSIQFPMDIEETDASYLISADLPGVAKENIEVSVQDGILTISAEHKSETSDKSDGKTIRRERYQGKFARTLKLSDIADQEKIEANYKDGVLHIAIPKVEKILPRKVEVAIQ